MGTDIKAQQERMQIADLLRLAKQGDVQTKLKQRELEQGERGLDIREREGSLLAQYRTDELGLRKELGYLEASLKSQGLSLEALGLKSLDKYRGDELALRRDISKIDEALKSRGLSLEQMGLENLKSYRDSTLNLQRDELKSLDTHREALITMQSRGLDLEQQRNQIQSFSAISDKAYKEGLLSGEDRRLDLETEKNTWLRLESDARSKGNSELANLHKMQADRAEIENNILREYTKGNATDAAKKILGLPVKSYSEIRNEVKDIATARTKLEEFKDDEPRARAYMDAFHELAGGESKLVYFWDSDVWDKEAKPLELPKLDNGTQLTLGFIKKRAAEKGISINDYILKIKRAMEKK